MKEDGTGTPRWSGIWKLVGKYKFVLIVILAGVVLLALPRSGGGSTDRTGVEMDEIENFDLAKLEQGMEQALSRIDGAGDVSVVLTLRSGSRKVVAEDTRTSDTETSSETVVVSQGSGSQNALMLQEIYPQFRGALIVCDGGNDPGVKLKILEAVAALTGLDSSSISICASGG